MIRGVEDFLFRIPPAPPMDHGVHNREAEALWEALPRGTAHRVPVRFTCNTRMLVCDPCYNTRGIGYRALYEDADLLWETVLEFQYWQRHHLVSDLPSGPPERWGMGVEGQNFMEAAWFGAPVRFPAGGVPAPGPLLDDDRRRMLFDRGIPHPLRDGGWMERATEFCERFAARAGRESFLGIPVSDVPGHPGLGTDGPFTVAALLRGAENLLVDMLTDPGYYAELLGYVVEATIERIRAVRAFMGLPAVSDAFFLADDSAAMLSVEQYRSHVLPHHRRLRDALAPGAPAHVHLCGDAAHLFPVLVRELGAVSFDTGFPMDFRAVRQALGPQITIHGGPPAALFLAESPRALLEREREILGSGVLEGRRFVLQEANNLPPCVPLEVIRAFYDEAKRLGEYR